MKLTFLGTGTSTGVPQINCDCHTCTSADTRDKRLRSSALLTLDDSRQILIDCGPDFRAQALEHPSTNLSAVLLTHTHYDHVGGIDDLRPFCYKHPGGLPLYARQDVIDDQRQRMPYSFASHLYPGVPTFNTIAIEPGKPFTVDGDIPVLPVEVLHYKLPILGFRFGPLAYVTDCKTMPPETMESLRGLDTLVLNALRHEEHISHLNLRQALDIIDQLKPRRAFLTHLSHDMGRHADTTPTLPPGVQIATDGLTISIPSD